MRTIHKSSDGQFTIAQSNRSGGFFVCKFDPSARLYRKTHIHPFWSYIEACEQFNRVVLPQPVSFYVLFDNPIDAGLWFD